MYKKQGFHKTYIEPYHYYKIAIDTLNNDSVTIHYTGFFWDTQTRIRYFWNFLDEIDFNTLEFKKKSLHNEEGICTIFYKGELVLIISNEKGYLVWVFRHTKDSKRVAESFENGILNLKQRMLETNLKKIIQS
ncbi:MAG: hypothetical protein JST86_09225 [Bacteroidetes bacterium]|nr:hypothetical protein [Bacteroidota bacterium]